MAAFLWVRLTNLTAQNAQLTASEAALQRQLTKALDALDAANATIKADTAIIARDKYKLTQANATIVSLTARVRKDEAAIAADARAEHGK